MIFYSNSNAVVVNRAGRAYAKGYANSGEIKMSNKKAKKRQKAKIPKELEPLSDEELKSVAQVGIERWLNDGSLKWQK